MMLTSPTLKATMMTPLTHSAVGLRTPETTGHKAAFHAVFCCPAKIKAVLYRVLSMVDCSGQPSGWPVPVAGSANPVQSATQDFALLRGGYSTLQETAIMHTLKTPNKSVSAQSRFNVITRSGRSLARYVPFSQAIRLKASHPNSLIKFAGMEGRA